MYRDFGCSTSSTLSFIYLLFHVSKLFSGATSRCMKDYRIEESEYYMVY